MPTNHKTMPAAERHPLPRYEFASLGAAEAYTYAASDTSCVVRVGTGPYDHYTVDHVVSGVGTLTRMTGDPLPDFGTGAGEIAEGNHDHDGLVSGGYYEKWDPDAEPATPNAMDDECNTSSVAGAWSTFDPGTGLTVTANAARGHYSFERAAPGAVSRWGGLYRAVPTPVSGEWQAIAKVSLWSRYDSGTGAGIGLAMYQAPGSAPLTSDLQAVCLHTNTNVSNVVANTPGQYDAYNGASVKIAHAKYVRIRVNTGGTAFTEFDYSPDGDTFFRVHRIQATPLTFFGPVTYAFGTSANNGNLRAKCHWIRVIEGVGESDIDTCTPPGRLVRVPLA